MKRIALAAGLVLMLIAELYLGTAFLPMKSQLAIAHRIADLFGQSLEPPPTHPGLHEEIGQVLREHPLLKVGLYSIVVTLFILNGLLMLKTSQYLRRRENNVPKATGG